MTDLQQDIFLKRPASEKPEKDGRYTLINENVPEADNYHFSAGKWWFVTNDITKQVHTEFTHWLQLLSDRSSKVYLHPI